MGLISFNEPLYDLPAKAGEPLALLSVACVLSRLLLILNINSVLAIASAAMGLLPAGMRWVQAFSCRVSVVPMAGRRGGRPRRPCRALSMVRRRPVMILRETVVVAQLSLWLTGCPVAEIGFTVSAAAHTGHRVMVCALRPGSLGYCCG